MRKNLVIAAAIIASLASCSKKDDHNTTTTPTKPTAKVMFTNACIGTGNLDVYLNDSILNKASNIAYMANSGYVSINPGSAKTAFVLQNANIDLVDTTLTYTANANYSVFATGAVNKASLFTTTDDLTVPASGKAKVRLINLSADNLSESMYVGNTKIDSGVIYKEATPFVTVNAGTSNVIVQDPNNVPMSKTLSGQVFASGKIYTIILTGTSNASGNSALTLTVINNN